MLITRVEVDGRSPLDVRVLGDRIAEIRRGLEARAGEPVLDGEGGALIAGLHDHHIHLLALAASEGSVACGPPAVCDAAALSDALASAPADRRWIRGTGYHDAVAGELDRERLDRIEATRPLRIQHRSGQLWLLNSAAVERLGLDGAIDHPGIERDAAGRATGRLFRADTWLRQRADDGEPPSLERLGRRLATYGVTGVTDATASNGAAELAILRRAVAAGHLPQRLVVMVGHELAATASVTPERGSLKLVLDERTLPRLDELADDISRAHDQGLAVAIHCVTRAELVVATAALTAAGTRTGDRIEHASVTPPELLTMIAKLGLTVVTQPGFVFERGDAYLSDVERRDQPWLYRCRGFVAAGIALGAGTDAPFGEADPWIAIRAAVDRRTRGGALIGAGEGLTPERALALFTTSAHAPGGAPRTVAPGAMADLCLLDQPWRLARERLCSDSVSATIRAGSLIWQRQHSSSATVQP